MKNTRIITALVAFVVTFIFSAGLVRIIFGEPQVATVFYNSSHCKRNQASNIEAFIRRDENNGTMRMDRISSLRDKDNVRYSAVYADAVMDYVNTSSNMDARRFPQDFQNAWREHMQAWRNYAEFLDDMNSPTARQEMSSVDLKSAENQYNKEINRTWAIVLTLGRSYGANV